MKKKPSSQRSDRDGIALYAFCLGLTCLAFIFYTFAIATLGFVVNVQVSPYHLPVALLLTALTAVFLSWHYYGQGRSIDLKVLLSLIAIFAGILLLSWLIAHNIYDVSFDGQWYHQGAIHNLVNGYNPVYGEVQDSYPGGTFITHYPKALEISSAVVNAFTNYVEDGKLINILLIAAGFLLVFYAILAAFPKVDTAFAALIAALCAFNPISIYQSMSYYVDGASASTLAILVFLLVLAYKKMDRLLYVVITGTIVLAINYKFFDLVYVAVLVAGFLAICFINKKATALHYLLLLSLVIGLLFGFNPYITNVIGHGTPFYPVEGINDSLISSDKPTNFAGLNQAEQFAYSIFSESIYQKANATLKIPFTFSTEELDAFTQTDARAGGFGPLTGGIFLLTIALAVSLLYVEWKNKRPLTNFIFLACLLVFATAIVNPAAWWARYVPQLWSIPLLLLLCARQQFTGEMKNLRIISYALILALFVNVLIVASVYYPNQLNLTGQIDRQMGMLKATSEQKPVEIYLGTFAATEDLYKEHGIHYVLLDSKPDKTGYRLGFSYDISMFYP